MSCGQIALKQLGITPEIYYASEIDKHAIRQAQLNFPGTIQLGDVVFLRRAMCFRNDIADKLNRSVWISEKTKKRFNELRSILWHDIDLILAGSPCQGFSFAGKQLAFDDPRSRLFFEFIKILNHIRSLNPDVKFLLENVKMKKSHMRVISQYCGVFPVNINSNLVSAQNRDRWYWTNIRTKQIGLFGEVYTDIPQPEDRGIFLRDILESEVDEKYYVNSLPILKYITEPFRIKKKYTQINGEKAIPQMARMYQSWNGNYIVQLPQGKNKGGIYEGKTPTISACSWEHNNLLSMLGYIRRLTPLECSRLQTVPAGYRWECSDTQIYKMLGNGWTIDVIVWILGFMLKTIAKNGIK